jgi:hypothetical protein
MISPILMRKFQAAGSEFSSLMELGLSFAGADEMQ